MKSPRVSGLALLLLLSSCSSRTNLSAQTRPRSIDPPEKFRFCVRGPDGGNESCETDSWAQDHYNVDGSRDELDYVTITQWSGGKVVIRRNYRLTLPGNVSTRGMDPNAWMDCSGQIASSGDHTEHGVISGGMHEGTCSLTWDPGSSSRAVAKSVVERQETAALWAKENERIKAATASPAHRVGGILVPAGASDVFATYPDDVRAILQPEHPLTLDPTRPCDDRKEDDTGTGVTDPVTALEIGKFALRRGEYARGHCWINHSAYLGSVRGAVLLGIMHLMGWNGPKDPKLAFHYFDGGGFRQRDPWAIYFMEQAFLNGNGATKDKAKAAGFDTYLMTHDDGQQVYAMIGADDANVMWRAERMKAMADASTKPESTCSNSPRTDPRTGAISYQQHCDTTYVVDNEALQRKLADIDRKYQAEMKQSK